MTTWRQILLVALVCMLGGGHTFAASPENEKQARRTFERAEEHFKAGLFAEALAEYRAGYEQLPLPGFLINIAQCQRRLGDLTQARATYRRFILVAPDSPYVGEVRSLITELDKVIEASGESTPAPGKAPGNSETAQPQAQTPSPVEPPALDATGRATEMSANNLVSSPATTAQPDTAPTRWWLWGSIGAAVVVASAVTLYALKSPGTTTLHDGSLGTLRR